MKENSSAGIMSKAVLVKGEGVVIKNQSKLRDGNSKYPSILKFVIENLCEIAKKNKVNKDKMNILNEAKGQTAQIVTKKKD